MSITPKPLWANNDYVTYGEIVKSFGYEVVAEEDFGDFQGDFCYILKDGNRIGYLIVGYGSCSGCDALQDATPFCLCDHDCICDWSNVVQLRDSIFNSIKWESPDNALPENHWWVHEDGVKEWLVSAYESAVKALDGEQG